MDDVEGYGFHEFLAYWNEKFLGAIYEFISEADRSDWFVVTLIVFFVLFLCILHYTIKIWSLQRKYKKIIMENNDLQEKKQSLEIEIKYLEKKVLLLEMDHLSDLEGACHTKEIDDNNIPTLEQPPKST